MVLDALHRALIEQLYDADLLDRTLAEIDSAGLTVLSLTIRVSHKALAAPSRA